MSTKVVLKLVLHDEKDKVKAMKTVSGISGVETISMNSKEMKLTVIGDVDPVNIVSKLRKLCHTDILTVGPAKEPETKKEEPKKEEPKKEDPKKQPEEKKKEPAKDPKDDVAELMKAYNRGYNPYPLPYPTSHYYVRSAEEDPNACVIC